MDIRRGDEPSMSTIQHSISQLIQQGTARLSGLPLSFLLFFAVLAGFIALILVLVILRFFWRLVLAIFGVRRPRYPRLNRPVPARFYSTDWAKERERRRRELARRLRR